MPNPLRVIVPGGIYHIWTHGSDERPLFVYDDDRRMFLALLANVVKAHDLTCIAWCQMTNHHHLVIQTPDESLPTALQELHGCYSCAFNRSHGRSAHLFRNRYGSRLIESDEDLLGACRYVAHNPCEAGMCRDPADWPWSSYRVSIGREPPPPFLADDAIGDALGGGEGWRDRYTRFVEGLPFAAL